MPTSKELKAKKSEGTKLAVTVHVGKNGLTDATLAEVAAQLKAKRLVKVRLLRSATSDSSDKDQAEQLADSTDAILVDVRGHTAVLWRPTRD